MRVALLGLVVGGCSLLGVQGPPKVRGPAAPVECTDSSALAPIDAVGALAFGLLGLFAGIGSFADTDPALHKAFVIETATFLPITAAYSASMLYGAAKVDACRRAKAEQAEALAADRREREQRF